MSTIRRGVTKNLDEPCCVIYKTGRGKTKCRHTKWTTTIISALREGAIGMNADRETERIALITIIIIIIRIVIIYYSFIYLIHSLLGRLNKREKSQAG